MQTFVQMGSRVLGFAVLLAGLFAPGMARAEFAAIAYNTQTGAVGYSNNYDSRFGAEERALQECGRGCEVVAWVEEGCAGLASGKGGGWGWSHSPTKEGAIDLAMRNCKKYTTGCVLKAWTCSG